MSKRVNNKRNRPRRSKVYSHPTKARSGSKGEVYLTPRQRMQQIYLSGVREDS